MSRLKTYTRRAFILTSTAVAGGFALGYWAYKRTPDNPLAENLEEGEITLSPYLLFTNEGLAIVAPRAELGQGVHSALAALVAEELEVSLEQIKVIHGPISEAYWNGAALNELFPLPSTEKSWKKDVAESTGHFIAKVLGMQATGGSSSIPDSYDKMRRAGAAGREMLLMAAASIWQVDGAKLSVEKGVVFGPDGQQATYQELASKAAEFDPPKDPPLKPKSDFKLIGKPMRRVDMVPKCTGTARFGIDLDFPNMVYA